MHGLDTCKTSNTIIVVLCICCKLTCFWKFACATNKASYYIGRNLADWRTSIWTDIESTCSGNQDAQNAICAFRKFGFQTRISTFPDVFICASVASMWDLFRHLSGDIGTDLRCLPSPPTIGRRDLNVRVWNGFLRSNWVNLPTTGGVVLYDALQLTTAASKARIEVYIYITLSVQIHVWGQHWPIQIPSNGATSYM